MGWILEVFYGLPTFELKLLGTRNEAIEQVEYFRAEAQLATAEAAKATDPERREHWLKIAQSWISLLPENLHPTKQ